MKMNLHYLQMTLVSLMYVHHDLNFIVDYVNERLSRIFEWCNFNKLSINPAKSEFMLISIRLIEAEPVLYLGNDRIIEPFDLQFDLHLFL